NLAEAMGPSVGGLLNATFGNAAELIIALFALRKGEVDLVKASITGSILGNILLVLGVAIVAGGCVHRRQTFNRTAASLGATMLALASIGLVIPTIFFHLTTHDADAPETLNYLSEEIAAILALMYVLSLVFSLVTHRHLFAEGSPPTQPSPTRGEGDTGLPPHPQPLSPGGERGEMRIGTACIVLLIAT